MRTAYVDLGNSNTTTTLEQIDDSRYSDLVYQNWLDNNNVIYQTKKTSTAYDFSAATVQTSKQNIGNKDLTAIVAPSGDLAQAFQVAK